MTKSDYNSIRISRKLLRRIFNKVVVDPETQCWLKFPHNHAQYAKIAWQGQNLGVHRLTYRLFVGPIEAHLVIDHLCRRPCCINPAHLEMVTPQENARRGEGFNSESCAKGHPMTGYNVGLYPNGDRYCRECRTDWLRQKRSHIRNEKIASGKYVQHEYKVTKILSTHCGQGHEYTESNTHWNRDARWQWRSCKRCHTLRERERRHRRNSQISEI